MKRLVLSVAIILTLGLGANAQSSDGFFTTTYSEYNEIKRDQYGNLDAIAPALPRFDLVTEDADHSAVPVGSGLMLLAGMGAAYAMRKRRK